MVYHDLKTVVIDMDNHVFYFYKKKPKRTIAALSDPRVTANDDWLRIERKNNPDCDVLATRKEKQVFCRVHIWSVYL